MEIGKLNIKRLELKQHSYLRERIQGGTVGGITVWPPQHQKIREAPGNIGLGVHDPRRFAQWKDVSWVRMPQNRPGVMNVHMHRSNSSVCIRKYALWVHNTIRFVWWKEVH